MGSPRGGGGGFHFEQALEKLLKAFLIARGWPVRPTHNLAGLIHEAEARESGFLVYLGLAERVRRWYWAGRYGDAEEPPPTLAEVRQAREEAQPLIERIRRTVAQGT